MSNLPKTSQVMRFIQSGWKYMLVLVLCGCWILLFNPLKWLLPARNNFFHMPALISTLLNSLGAPLQVSGVLSLCSSLLSGTPPCKPYRPRFSLDCPLYFFNSGHSLGCAWIPSLCAMVWKFSQSSKSGQL